MNDEGATPLHLAAGRGNVGVARLLLKSNVGALPDVPNHHNATPLHYASYAGHFQMASLRRN